jgi:hypothetical protein
MFYTIIIVQIEDDLTVMKNTTDLSEWAALRQVLRPGSPPYANQYAMQNCNGDVFRIISFNEETRYCVPCNSRSTQTICYICKKPTVKIDIAFLEI